MYQGDVGIRHRHWRTGLELATSVSHHTAPQFREGRTHRVPLHNLLLSHVKKGSIHYGKAVSSIEVVNDDDGRSREVHLSLSDGSVAKADLVVAADGIYSVSAPGST